MPRATPRLGHGEAKARLRQHAADHRGQRVAQGADGHQERQPMEVAGLRGGGQRRNGADLRVPAAISRAQTGAGQLDEAREDHADTSGCCINSANLL